MMSKLRIVLLIVFLLSFAFVIISCSSQNKHNMDQQEETQTKEIKTNQNNQDYPSHKENPVVTITMASDKEIIIELYPDIAPNTVNNFISLVQDGFYNGLTFHRVVPGFIIQGGNSTGHGKDDLGYSIEGEFDSNDFSNDLKHTRGVISMARSEDDPNSAGSQFFIVQRHSPQLDGDYAAFGEVIEGMDVVDNIAADEHVDEETNQPIEDQVMEKVEVDKKGFEYDEPEIIENEHPQ